MNATNPKNFEGLTSASEDAMRTVAANPGQTVYFPSVKVRSDVQDFLTILVDRAKSPGFGSVVYVQLPKGRILRVEIKELGK